MLVMSRREGDTILIGDDVEIVITHIGRSRVKVGIRAPRTVPIMAREMKLVRDENLVAAAHPPSSVTLGTLLARLNSLAPIQGSVGPPDKVIVRHDAGT
jgi:carbon storage regulator